jgi:hypothetical protein
MLQFQNASPAEDTNAASIAGLRHVPWGALRSRYQFAKSFDRGVMAGIGRFCCKSPKMKGDKNWRKSL